MKGLPGLNELKLVTAVTILMKLLFTAGLMSLEKNELCNLLGELQGKTYSFILFTSFP